MASSTTRLTAITPPKAETGSQETAFSYADGDRLGDRHPAGVVVLDDDAGRQRELFEQPPGRVEVEQVVERERGSVELLQRGGAVRAAYFGVPGRPLVRVLAVAEVLDLDQVDHQVLGEVGFLLGEPVGDGGVVVSGVVEGLGGQLAAGLARQRTLRTPLSSSRTAA